MVLLFHNILWSHYKAAVFSELQKILDDQEIEFKVIHFAKSEIARKLMTEPDLSVHNYNYTVLDKDFVEEWNPIELTKVLISSCKKYKPSFVILPGINDLAVILLSFYLSVRNVTVFNTIDSTIFDRNRSRKKEFLKKILFRLYDGFYCYGSLHKQYLRSLDISEDKIYLRGQATKLDIRDKNKQEGTKKYDFVFIGRLSPEKNLERTLDAFSSLPSEPTLAILGSGPLEEFLVDRYKSNGNIHFIGNVANSEVHFYLNLSRFLFLTSISETWGLVVNEAMMFGLPVLVSKHCGCSGDLVKNNGFLIDPLSSDSIKNGILRCLKLDDMEYNRFSHRSKEIIKEFTPVKAAIQMAKPIIKKIR